MLRNWLFFSVVATIVVIMIITLLGYSTKDKAIYYNAYAIEYDEYYVLKSNNYQQLGDTIIDCDTRAVILSPYIR